MPLSYRVGRQLLFWHTAVLTKVVSQKRNSIRDNANIGIMGRNSLTLLD